MSLNRVAFELTVDQEQNAGNYGTDPCDHCNGKASEAHAYEEQAIQD